MRILFMGSDPIALPLLEFLNSKSERLVVVSGVDKPVGRGQKVIPNEISSWALAHNVELMRPQRLDDAFHQSIEALSPDMIFVMAYGKILKESLINLPRLGTWNLHASALPKLRGASPIETAIAIGLPETAVELMKMALAMDVGPVGASIAVPIGQKNSAELREEIGRISRTLVEKNWSALAAGDILTVTQDETQATYCRILKKEDGWLDPNEPAEVLCNHVRAFSEWPGSAFIYAGERLKVYAARAISDGSSRPPGTVLESGERLVVAVGKGSLEILSLQRPGGKRLAAREFLLGYPIPVGEKFFGQPLRPLVDSKPFPRGF